MLRTRIKSDKASLAFSIAGIGGELILMFVLCCGSVAQEFARRISTFGAIAAYFSIAFAVLSYIKNRRMSRNARLGISFSLLAIIVCALCRVG
jgi:hypothetical protein